MIATSSAKFAVSVVILAGLLTVVVDSLASKTTSHTVAQGSSVTDTLQALDTNKNGKVDRSEIETFARSQGMSPQDVMGDFKDLDTNGDGELEYSEIANVLSEADSQQQQQQAATSQPTAVTAHTENTALQTPIAAAAAQTGNVAVLPPPSNVEVEPVAAIAPNASALVSTGSKKQADSATDLQSLQQNAGLEAGRILATKFASLAQQLMAKSDADQNKATTYEKEARALRGRAATILQSASQETKRVAADTAAKVGQAAKPRVERMKVEAEQLEVKAGEQRTLAHKAFEQVSKAQSLMASLFQRIHSA